LEKALFLVDVDEDNTLWRSEVANISAGLVEAIATVGGDPKAVLQTGQDALAPLLLIEGPYQDWQDLAFRYDYLTAKHLGNSSINAETFESIDTPNLSTSVIWARLAILLVERGDQSNQLLEEGIRRLEATIGESESSGANITYARLLRATNRVDQARTIVQRLLERGSRLPDLMILSEEILASDP